MLKEVCFDCQRQMQVDQVSITLLELDGNGDAYKLWHADVLKCPDCRREIVARFADRPISQQGIEGFQDRVSQTKVLCTF